MTHRALHSKELLVCIAGVLLFNLSLSDVSADHLTGPQSDQAAQRKPENEIAAADREFFEAKIRPVLIKHCYECHKTDSEDIGGDLLVDSRAGLLRGGESGPAILPGNPKQSLLMEALEYRGLEMPPDEQLPADVIADFRRWIRLGAPDPREATANMPQQTEAAAVTDLWSLQPITVQNPAPEDESGWADSEVDRFVAHRRRERGLDVVADADPDALLRRLSFDLIGLPPSPELSHEFRQDPSLAHFEEIAKRFLASPQFGERWGRHWLDVVRFGESAGNSRDVLIPYAYRYRNYVIEAYNNDLPYDRFLTEQLAGDLLPAETPEERTRLQVATGLLAVGSKSLNGGNLTLDLVDDQIDVVGKAMMGLAISCARCHDHKFDPIPTADYYALAGIFKSTETLYGGNTNRPKTMAAKLKVYLPLGKDAEQLVPRITKHEQQIAQINKRITNLTKQSKNQLKSLPKNWKAELTRIRSSKVSNAAGPPESSASGVDTGVDETGPKAAAKSRARTQELSKADAQLLGKIERFQKTSKELAAARNELKEAQSESFPSIDLTVGVREAKKIADSRIHLRGERTKTGDVVPRGFLSCVSLDKAPEISGNRSSGRLELAQWLTQPEHPLTARVYVNRIWQHLFGRGLVETVDNFGVNGTPPTHPQLLDYLAHRFVHVHEWSTKSLILELIQTRAYRLSSAYSETQFATDPGNTSYWRMSKRRLEAEAIRDAMLTASGALELERPEQSLVTVIGEGEVGRGINTKVLARPFPHRSVYLPIIRGLIPEFLKVFDLPEPSNPQGQRDATNVPAQSLFLMNSPFVLRHAEMFGKRVLALATNDRDRIQAAFGIALSRPATPEEVDTMATFLVTMRSKLATQMEDEQKREQMCWTLLCQSLFGSAEFRYLQ